MEREREGSGRNAVVSKTHIGWFFDDDRHKNLLYEWTKVNPTAQPVNITLISSHVGTPFHLCGQAP